MSQKQFPRVTGHDGLRGYIETPLIDSVLPNNVVVRLESGQTIMVPASLLVAQSDGSYQLPLSREELETAATGGITQPTETLVIPVIAEEISITKLPVETGLVRIRKTVREHEETIDDPLLREKVTVETVPINQVITGAIPSVCQVGDTTIIPIVEEVLVVEKRLILKEEIHIRREQQTYHDPQTVTLRTEEVHVERVEQDQLPLAG